MFEAMLTHDLALLVNVYLANVGDKASALSSRVFDDSRVIPRVLAGQGSLTLRRAELLIGHLSAHWPPDLDWPSFVPRPPVSHVDRALPSLIPASDSGGAA